MPWEITIAKYSVVDSGTPLGDRDDVVNRFNAALPNVQLRLSSPPPAELLELLPASVREAMMIRRFFAEYDGDDLSIEFYAPDHPVLNFINAEIRGNGNPIPILAAICFPNGWDVFDATTRSMIDLSMNSSMDWDRFRDWRDKALGSIQTEDI